MKLAIMSCCLGWAAYAAAKLPEFAGPEGVLLLLLSLLFFLMCPLFAFQSYLEAKRNV